jgi:hypothetical protein
MKQHHDLADAQITTNEIVMTALKQVRYEVCYLNFRKGDISGTTLVKDYLCIKMEM